MEQDLSEGIAGVVPVPPDEAGKDPVIDALVANVEAMIKADRKITSLKQLQVLMASPLSLSSSSSAPSCHFTALGLSHTRRFSSLI